MKKKFSEKDAIINFPNTFSAECTLCDDTIIPIQTDNYIYFLNNYAANRYIEYKRKRFNRLCKEFDRRIDNQKY